MTDSQRILNEFISNIKQIGEKKGFYYEPRIAIPTIKNIFNLTQRENRALICTISTHVSTGEKPLWGIMKNTIDEFQQEKMNWGIVLLHKTSESGYLLSSTDVINNLRYWPLSSKAQYLVTLNNLINCKKFYSINVCIDLLIQINRPKND